MSGVECNAHRPPVTPAAGAGFTLIREIERYLNEANSYAGHYESYTDPETEELVITGEYEEEYEATMNDARAIARMVARSNGYRILRAQERTGEGAQLVYDEHYFENHKPCTSPSDAWWIFDD
ncbi:hypothetical protein [Sphingomonas oryzagri]